MRADSSSLSCSVSCQVPLSPLSQLSMLSLRTDGGREGGEGGREGEKGGKEGEKEGRRGGGGRPYLETADAANAVLKDDC